MAKKEVFVWVARDEDESCAVFSAKPISTIVVGRQMFLDHKCDWGNIKPDAQRVLKLDDLKPGECRKYKLVEIKED